MQITRNSLDSFSGRPEWFTGTVITDQIANSTPESRFAGVHVHFMPGARSAWHTHPFGQTIYITEGVGRCQRRGGPIEELLTGDRVFFEPGEEHWHGAAPTRFMSHLAIQQVDEDGRAAAWGEHVTDEEYNGPIG